MLVARLEILVVALFINAVLDVVLFTNAVLDVVLFTNAVLDVVLFTNAILDVVLFTNAVLDVVLFTNAILDEEGGIVGHPLGTHVNEYFGEQFPSFVTPAVTPVDESEFRNPSSYPSR